jgi:hypothetical protein
MFYNTFVGGRGRVASPVQRDERSPELGEKVRAGSGWAVRSWQYTVYGW